MYESGDLELFGHSDPFGKRADRERKAKMIDTAIEKRRDLGRAALAVMVALVTCAALLLMLEPSAWAGAESTNAIAITINDNAPASPYPSTISAGGIPRTITDLNVTLNDISHPYPDALDILLVGPDGQKVMLMSDAGGAFSLDHLPNLTFDDSSAPPSDSGAISCCRVSPVNYESPDNMPAPAPGEPYGTSLSVFDGTDPNGTWSLFVQDDDGFGDTGQIAGGWSLDITAATQNDDFANAQAINSDTATITGDNIASGFEADEPNSFFSGGSVWYRWTAPNTGQTTIDTCNTDYDPIMGVFTGSAVNSLTPPGPGLGFINNGCVSGFGDKATFTAQAGTTYNIQVSGSPQGNFTINLSGPANTPPTSTPRSPRPGSSTRDRTPRIRAIVGDSATDLAKANIKLFVDGKVRPFSYDQATNGLLCTSNRLSFGRHTVKVVATDAHGGTATKNWRFRVAR
jgi:subtilisin-like proprotein convertase family protein